MKNKSYICLLTSGRIFDTQYGESRFTLNLGKWLSKKNENIILMGSGFARVKVRYLSKSESEDRIIKQGKKIQVIYPPYFIYMISRLIFSILWFFKILFLNFATPIKLIHSQDTGYAGLAAIFAGKILRVPVVISSHGIRHKTIASKYVGRFSSILAKLEYRLDIFSVKHADLFIVINNYIKEYFETIISKEIKLIPSSLKTQNFTFSQENRRIIRKELGIDSNSIVVGYVGRLSPEKNVITLISSFDKVLKNRQDIILVVVGNGILEAELKKLVNEKGIQDKIIFCGARDDVEKILSCFDIFVLPSKVEGLSIALLEAMTCERAIICSDIAANKQLIIHQKEGLLINPKNIQDIENAIIYLSNNEMIRKEMGMKAKIKADQYDEDVIFPKILQCYNELLN